MNISIYVDPEDNIQIVSDGKVTRNNHLMINLGEVTIEMKQQVAEAIYRGIEQALWSEEEWRDNLADRVDELETLVSKLEDKLDEQEQALEYYYENVDMNVMSGRY